MNNLFQNKKVLIAAGVSVGVIILAIIIFIAIGVKDKKAQKQRVSTIQFDNTTQSTNQPTTSAETGNKVDNSVDTPRPSNEEVLEEVDENYKDALLCFIDALIDKSEMKSFIKDYFDSTAYLAYEEVDYNDEKLFDVIGDISSEDAKEVENNLLAIPEKLSELKDTKQGLSDLSNSLDSNTTTESKTEDIDVYITEVSEIDHYNDEDDRFSRAYLTVNLLTEEEKFILTFFENVDEETEESTFIIINITDDEGNTIFDVIDNIE